MSSSPGRQLPSDPDARRTPRPDPPRGSWVHRAAAITAGLVLVGAYLFCPAGLDPVSRIGGALESIGAYLRAHQRDYCHETFLWFVRTYARILVWLLPALVLLTWGLAGLIHPARLLVAALRRRTTIVAGAVILAAVATQAVGRFGLDYYPITERDEWAYLFQAKLLASGRLYAPSPPVPEAFRNESLVTTPRWHATYFAGHPLALVPGLWAGWVHLVPSLIAAVTVWLTYAFAREVFGEAAGLLAAVMLTLSPFFIFYHATLLPEPTVLVLLSAFLVLVVKSGRDQSVRWMIAAAASLAAAVITRPHSACLYAAPAALWVVFRPGLPRRRRIRSGLILLSGLGLGIILLLWYAHATSGAPFGSVLSPGYHTEKIGGFSRLGFSDRHTPLQGLLNLGVTLTKMNFALFGWPVSLIPLVWWARKGGKSAWEYLLAAAVLLLFGFYFLYPGRQEQYYLETVQLMTVLAAIGLVAAYRNPPAGLRMRLSRPLLVGFVMVCYLLAAVSVWPFRAAYFRERSAPDRRFWQAVHHAGIHHALVVVRDLPRGFRADLGHNSPDLDDDVILARAGRIDDLADFAARFPGRAVYEVRPSRLDEQLVFRQVPRGRSLLDRDQPAVRTTARRY